MIAGRQENGAKDGGMREMQNTPPDLTLLKEAIALLYKALGSTLGILIILIGVIYHQLRESDKDAQKQLDEGNDDFEAIRLEINSLKHDVAGERAYHDLDMHEKVQVVKLEFKTLKEKIAALDLDIELLEKAYKEHDKSLTLIKDHHYRNHQERVE